MPRTRRLSAAAAVSNILPDIQQFPSGFNTIVGERGITLSGGQKQRTAISRAVIRDPKILILDDALSSVDTYTEEQILHELEDVMSGRTSILISHRVSTVKDADEIVVMDHGEIVERGTHEQLLAHGGYYAELHRATTPGRRNRSERIAVHDEEVLGKAYDARLMRRLIGYLRPYRKQVVAAFLLMVFDAALETIPPLLTMLAIDRYIAAGNAGGLAIVAGVYVLILAVKFGTEFIQALHRCNVPDSGSCPTCACRSSAICRICRRRSMTAIPWAG